MDSGHLSIFEFAAYKPYLHKRVGRKGDRRGLKSALARALRCQPTFVSQVLNGAAQFSAEQAEDVNEFLGHSREEGRYFLLLVLKERAGTRALRKVFEDQIEEQLAKRLVLTERLGKQSALNSEQQSIYYSSWHYAAVHMALTIPALKNRESIARTLRLPLVRVAEVVEFLLSVGLAREAGAGLEVGSSKIRLGSDSHYILKHHANWRVQALQSLDRVEAADLHYSAVFSLSQKDRLRLKDVMIEFIKQNATTIESSKEEQLCAMCMDFFGVGEA